MGRGFGRGAKAVGIVTHSQVKGKKKLPKGLRSTSSRKKRRANYREQQEHDVDIENGGVGKIGNKPQGKGQPSQASKPDPNARKSLASQIAGIQLPEAVNGRKKGFKGIRKQLMAAVRDVRKRYHQKARKNAQKDIEQKSKLLRLESVAARGTSASGVKAKARLAKKTA